jgi:DNA-binding beta-propeller fold protein YncE
MRILSTLLAAILISSVTAQAETRHLLYVAVPGIRNYPQYGGNGILVFDIDHGHQFVRRIPIPGLGTEENALASKGICANAKTGKLYVSSTEAVTCINLDNDAILWEQKYADGCDRMSITPDGSTIYEPTLEGKYWHVINGATGEEMMKIPAGPGAHNTIVSLDGKHAYLAGLHSPTLTVVNTETQKIERGVGPFAKEIRPFTVNGAGTLCYVNINELLGFEIGDLTSGAKLARVEVQGFEKGPEKRHGCPSHGIALTPDEKEIWVTDAHNSRLHIFDNTVMPPKQLTSILLGDQPGWITFSIDGRYAYPSSGEVIDPKSRKILMTLKDERGQAVQSEKLLEIDFDGSKCIATGDQFGLGRVTPVQ